MYGELFNIQEFPGSSFDYRNSVKLKDSSQRPHHRLGAWLIRLCDKIFKIIRPPPSVRLYSR